MLMFDRLALTSQRYYTDEGFLTVPARIARTGIQDYSAISLGKTDGDPNEVVRVYRPPEEVFDEESLNSFRNKPVTNEHPPELVTADNARKYSVGQSGPEILRDGSFMKATLTIQDGATVELVKKGKVELSNGYTCDIEWSPGQTPDGLQYDAVQRNIRGNHIAVVSRGRAGPECKLADSSTDEGNAMQIVIDGVEYEVTNQIAQAVGKLQAQLKDAEEKVSKAESQKEEDEKEVKEAVKAKDEALAQLDSLKSKVPNAEALDKLVADRQDLVAKCCKLVADIKWEGKDEATLKREVVAAKCPGVTLDSVSEDYVNARFDILVEDSETNPQKVLDEALKTQVKDKGEGDNRPLHVIARDEMIKRSKEAWKGGNS